MLRQVNKIKKCQKISILMFTAGIVTIIFFKEKGWELSLFLYFLKQLGHNQNVTTLKILWPIKYLIIILLKEWFPPLSFINDKLLADTN